MKRRIIALLAVGALAMSLLACGSQGAASSEAAPAESEAAPAESEAAESTAEDEGPNVGKDEDRPMFGTLTDDQIKVGESMMDLKNPFFIAVQKGAKAYCEAKGYELILADGESNAEKQINDVESMISAGITILDCRVNDTTSMKDKLQEVRDMGIAINTYPFMEESDTIVGYNNYDQGVIEATDACEWMLEKYDGKCKVAMLTQPAAGDLMQRVKGFHDTLEKMCPEAEIVGEFEAYQPDTGLEVTESILQKDPDTRVFLCVNDSGAMGAYEAVMTKDEAHADEYWIGGIDGTNEAFDLMKTGGPFRCSVASKYWVEENTWMLLDNLICAAKGEPYVYVVPMECLAVNQDNVDEYTAREIDYESLPNVYDAYKDFNWSPT